MSNINSFTDLILIGVEYLLYSACLVSIKLIVIVLVCFIYKVSFWAAYRAYDKSMFITEIAVKYLSDSTSMREQRGRHASEAVCACAYPQRNTPRRTAVSGTGSVVYKQITKSTCLTERAKVGLAYPRPTRRAAPSIHSPRFIGFFFFFKSPYLLWWLSIWAHSLYKQSILFI